MDQGEKTSLSFFSIAVSFFILIVLPLTITGVIISKGVVKVGEEATQANLRVLNDSQKLSIEGRAQNMADAVAQFLTDMEKDIRIATILPRDENSYATFLRSNTRGVNKASKVGIIKIPKPIFREIAFLDKNGNETLKVTSDGVASKDILKDMSKPENGEYGYEDYFIKAKSLAPGEYYMGPVVGKHVERQEYEAGERFDGIVRMSAPVFDSTGFAGVVELALNYVHIMEFTDHIIPTEVGLFYVDVKAKDINYAYMVDRNGYVISHPSDYLLGGLDENNDPIPVMDETNYDKLIKTGTGIMNVMKMGFLDENLPRMHTISSKGESGSYTYTLDDKRIFVVYAHIPYYGSRFSKPEGYGWIGMMVDIDKYNHLSQEKVSEIKKKVERWQKSSIIVVFVSLILLFIIALILARGLYRSIQNTRHNENMMPLEDDDD